MAAPLLLLLLLAVLPATEPALNNYTSGYNNSSSNGGNAPIAPTAAAARPAVGPKLVFAHYMLCFQAFSEAYPNPTHSAADVPGYIEEMALAQRHGVDGFALEYGFSYHSQAIYNASLHWMFAACERYVDLLCLSGAPVHTDSLWLSQHQACITFAVQVCAHLQSRCVMTIPGTTPTGAPPPRQRGAAVSHTLTWLVRPMVCMG